MRGHQPGSSASPVAALGLAPAGSLGNLGSCPPGNLGSRRRRQLPAGPNPHLVNRLLAALALGPPRLGLLDLVGHPAVAALAGGPARGGCRRGSCVKQQERRAAGAGAAPVSVNAAGCVTGWLRRAAGRGLLRFWGAPALRGAGAGARSQARGAPSASGCPRAAQAPGAPGASREGLHPSQLTLRVLGSPLELDSRQQRACNQRRGLGVCNRAEGARMRTWGPGCLLGWSLGLQVGCGRPQVQRQSGGPQRHLLQHLPHCRGSERDGVASRPPAAQGGQGMASAAQARPSKACLQAGKARQAAGGARAAAGQHSTVCSTAFASGLLAPRYISAPGRLANVACWPLGAAQKLRARPWPPHGQQGRPGAHGGSAQGWLEREGERSQGVCCRVACVWCVVGSERGERGATAWQVTGSGVVAARRRHREGGDNRCRARRRARQDAARRLLLPPPQQLCLFGSSLLLLALRLQAAPGSGGRVLGWRSEAWRCPGLSASAAWLPLTRSLAGQPPAARLSWASPHSTACLPTVPPARACLPATMT